MNDYKNQKNKKAIIFTYHTVFSKIRKGGIHYFYKYFLDNQYSQIDIITVDYFLYSFLKQNDRVNFHVLKSLINKNSIYERNSIIRNNVILTLKLPNIFYKLKIFKKMFFYLYDKTIYHPSYILDEKYDVCIIESSELLGNKLIMDTIERSKMSIYRPSDPVLLWSKIPEFIKNEEYIMNLVDFNLVINESSKEEYLREYNIKKPIIVAYNPMEYENLKTMNNSKCPYKTSNNLFYFGAFKLDYNLIKYLAQENPSFNFYIAGPYEDKLKLSNVHYLGFLPEEKAMEYIKYSDLIFVPYMKIGKINEILEVTRKILLFMLFKKPIVAINVSNKLQGYGIFVSKDYEDMNKLIRKNLDKTVSYDTEELVKKFSYNKFKNILDKLLYV